jgi:hypothetical protein
MKVLTQLMAFVCIAITVSTSGKKSDYFYLDGSLDSASTRKAAPESLKSLLNGIKDPKVTISFSKVCYRKL